MAEMPKLKGIADLRRLVGLIEAGCRSPLEVWGALHVFDGAGFACYARLIAEPDAVRREASAILRARRR